MPRRTAVAIAFVTLLLSVCACSGNSERPAASGVTNQVANRHDQVNTLIVAAKTAFDSPSRNSSAGSTAKTADNMQTVADRLAQANQLAPYRTDLLFSAASAQITRKDVPAAVALYGKVLDLASKDVDALSYLAGWNRYLGRAAESAGFMARLRTLDPARAAQMDLMFHTIDRVGGQPPSDALPNVPASGLAIVTLGYELNDDGSMSDVLVGRLRATLAAAARWPSAPIIVTGGNEEAGHTEGESMKDWLVGQRIAPDRIHAEDFATSTLENATYSVNLLAQLGATHTLLVSSASHVRRAEVIFELAEPETLGSGFPVVTLGYPDRPLTELRVIGPDELRLIYQNAFSALGMWAYRSAPLLQQ